LGQHDGDFHIGQANALCTIVSRLLSITLCRRMRHPLYERLRLCLSDIAACYLMQNLQLWLVLYYYTIIMAGV